METTAGSQNGDRLAIEIGLQTARCATRKWHSPPAGSAIPARQMCRLT